MSGTDILQFLEQIFLRIIPIIVAISVHESAHAFVAYKLGDMTAYNMGRISLNPAKHFDPLGALMMLFVGFGWARPVPVNMSNFKNPKLGMALTAIAGPVSNFIMLAVSLLFRWIFILISLLSGISGTVATVLEVLINICETGAMLNASLMLFNLIPLAPLDGSKVLAYVLPKRIYYKYMQYESYGMYIIIGLMLLDRFTPVGVFSKYIGGGAYALVTAIDTLWSKLFIPLAGG